MPLDEGTRLGLYEILAPLGAGGIRPRYLESGHIVYVSGTTIMAAPFDLGSLVLSGDAVPLIPLVRVRDSRMLNVASSVAAFDVSPSGTLVYFPDIESGAGRRLVRVDPSLPAEARVTVLGDNRVSRDVRVSPDGTRIAAQNQGGDDDIWIYDLERATMTRLTFGPGEDETAVWSPDGRDIVYAGQPARRTLFRVRADGSGGAETLWESEQHAHVHDWSPDGKWLVLDVDAGPNFDIWTLDLEGDEEPQPLLSSRFNEFLPRVSPDGRFFVYVSNESGRQEVYVQRFPDLGDKRQVSNEGGHHPIWSRDGRNIFYRTPTHVMAVDVRIGEAVELSPPVALFEDTFHKVIGSHGTFDVLPDGSFVMLEAEDTRAETSVNVVVDWIEEVKERVPR